MNHIITFANQKGGVGKSTLAILQVLTSAGDRGRTGTIDKDRRILSPVRLPISPLRHLERKTRFELATLALARRCSTTEPLALVPQNV